MRISELDDIEKAALLSAVVKRARADLNDGRPLTEMRRTERDYCLNCEAGLSETDIELGECTQCGCKLTESEDNDGEISHT